MQICFATKNEGKLKEIRSIFKDYEILSLYDVADGMDIEETGATFEENAVLKAETLCRKLSLPALADDSGLEVDYLNGAPGVLSARFMGYDTPYEVKNNRIIELLKNAKGTERSARFVCVIALARPGLKTITARGVIEGVIADTPRGENGFGYDPIFLVPELGKTTAELSPAEKNRISHRGSALRQIKSLMKGMRL